MYKQLKKDDLVALIKGKDVEIEYMRTQLGALKSIYESVFSVTLSNFINYNSNNSVLALQEQEQEPNQQTDPTEKEAPKKRKLTDHE